MKGTAFGEESWLSQKPLLPSLLPLHPGQCVFTPSILHSQHTDWRSSPLFRVLGSPPGAQRHLKGRVTGLDCDNWCVHSVTDCVPHHFSMA